MIPAAGLGVGAYLAGPALLRLLGEVMAPARGRSPTPGTVHLRRHASPCASRGGREAGRPPRAAYVIAYAATALSLTYGISHFWRVPGIPFGFPSQDHGGSTEALSAAGKPPAPACCSASG
ncbi:hypothetical protein GCM10027521_10580 [Amycolatopsis cihanbeyliensis]